MQIEALTTLRRRYDESAVRQFLDWWVSELKALLPEPVRARVTTGPGTLSVVAQDEELDLWFNGEGGQRRVGALELEADPAVARQQLTGLLERLPGDAPEMVLAIPGERVLEHRVLLPDAAAENLRQVLAFEMDRHTPFTAGDVYFDARVVDRHAATGKVAVELVLVRRGDVEALLDQVASRGINLSRMDVLDGLGEHGPELRGVNLLPEEHRARRHNIRGYINTGLVVMALALMALIMWKSLANKERGLELLSEQVVLARAEAMEVGAMRDELGNAVAGANFLIDQRSQKPTTIEILRILTELLPDEVWLQRFELQELNVQIQGEAPNASALINMLEESPVFAQAAFRSPVTRNQENDKERFSIAAELELAAEPVDEVTE